MAKEGGASAGTAFRCSSEAFAPAVNSAQCTGFSTSMPAHGIPSIICMLVVAEVSCGQTYEAIAIPELMIVMARKKAINRKYDGRFRCIGA